MADKFAPGSETTATWKTSDGKTRTIAVTVIEQTTPGWYRCQTNMGITIMFQESDLG